MTLDDLVILSDTVLPSPRLSDRGALQHTVLIRDQQYNSYTIVLPDAGYSPVQALAAVDAERERQITERARRLLSRE